MRAAGALVGGAFRANLKLGELYDDVTRRGEHVMTKMRGDTVYAEEDEPFVHEPYMPEPVRPPTGGGRGRAAKKTTKKVAAKKVAAAKKTAAKKTTAKQTAAKKADREEDHDRLTTKLIGCTFSDDERADVADWRGVNGCELPRVLA